MSLAEAIARIERRYGGDAIGRGERLERRRAERRIPTGTALDRLAAGGLAVGEALALVGEGSVGKLSLALRSAAGAQQLGGTVAWLDATASFDPLSAARAGVDLGRLVVVRARDRERVLLAGSVALRCDGFRMVVCDLGPAFASVVTADEVAPLVPLARGSSAALLVVADRAPRGQTLSWISLFGGRSPQTPRYEARPQTPRYEARPQTPRYEARVV